MTAPNMILDYICGKTGEVLSEALFYDPGLQWTMKTKPDGTLTYRLHKSYECGRPTDEWLRANPRPAIPWRNR